MLIVFFKFNFSNILFQGKYYIECDCSIIDVFYLKLCVIGCDLNKLGVKGNWCKDGVIVYYICY